MLAARGPHFYAKDSAWSFWKDTTWPAPKGCRAQPADAGLAVGTGTFTVHFGEQLAQGPLHLPGAADEGGHHLEQLVLVLLPDHRDGLQDELHLLQLMSPWGGKCQVDQCAAQGTGCMEAPQQ